MRQGAPDYVTDQPRLVSEVQPCADARIRCVLTITQTRGIPVKFTGEEARGSW
jgi:hypothetical protein